MMKTEQTITNYEIDIIDHYVIRNNVSRMNFAVFKNVVDRALPNWRSEELCAIDELGRMNYEKYITYTK